MINDGLGDAQAGIKIARGNISNLRYVDDTTLMTESKEELKNHLMKVKEESKNAGLKLNNQETKIMASGLISSVQFSSVTQSCLTLCDPMNRSTPGLPVHHELLSSLKLMSIESAMPSNHLILRCPLLLLPSILPSIRSFQMSQPFPSGGQSIRVSASTPVLPMNTQD